MQKKKLRKRLNDSNELNFDTVSFEVELYNFWESFHAEIFSQIWELRPQLEKSKLEAFQLIKKEVMTLFFAGFMKRKLVTSSSRERSF